MAKVKNKSMFKSDAKHTAMLIKAGREADANAIRVSKALGLQISYIENEAVIKELANGTKIIVKAAKSYKNFTPSLHFEIFKIQLLSLKEVRH